MPHIFISYAKKDTKSLALQLADALNALEGVTAWVDVQGITYGDEWETLIQRQIARCDYMVLLYSPDINRHIDDESQTESYVIKEIRYAQMRGKPIIPIMAQQTHPPMGLISIQYIDYANEGISSVELVNRLCRRMNITPVQKHPPTKPKIILPQPFDWCYIPAGKVTLVPDAVDSEIYIKQNTIVDVPAFWMAKYPVTNAQYSQFMQDKGYETDTWWTSKGILARNENKWTQPRFWYDPKFNGEQYPVVGVSWYEAVAFCRWLSHKTNSKIVLPSDAQWQRAAQGDNSRLFPWGNRWIPEWLNHSMYPTTPVTYYEGKGNSPFGVVDMAGNILEWCLTIYQTGDANLDSDEARVLRGGIWFYETHDGFEVTFRGSSINISESIPRGFRVACLID